MLIFFFLEFCVLHEPRFKYSFYTEANLNSAHALTLGPHVSLTLMSEEAVTTSYYGNKTVLD